MSFDLESLPRSRFDVSVVIPVEFHRGQTINCVRGWALEQDYPAEQYQIILCAPSTLSPDIEIEIRSMLRPWDRLERRPYHHDMPLVAEAARLAESEFLFFTESHCIPEGTALSQLIEEIKRHPDWSGFSCQTIPITHNLLSEIEAEIYATHIEKELDSTRGVKVIDQCFLVDRAAYFRAGGFRPSFGHFAEWLLAAEIQKLGFVIGFSSIQVIKHYYVGDVNDLEAFTLDFAKGHIKYLAEFSHESTSSYFPAIPELNEYAAHSSIDYQAMAKVKTITLPTIFYRCIKKWKNGEAFVPVRLILWDWFESLFAVLNIRAVVFFAFCSAYFAKCRVFQAIKARQREQVKTRFVDWFGRLVHLARLQYLFENPSIQNQHVRNQNYPISDEINFTVDSQPKTALEFFGFYDQEEALDNQRFRWSKNYASVWLPMHEGVYRIVIKWGKVRPISSHDLLSVNFNGRPISFSDMTLNQNELVIEVAVETKNWCCLSWSVIPFPANGDMRLLGLPITSIRWFSIDHALDSNYDALTAKLPVQPVYFLHVSKCAGTSLRLILDNSYQSSAIMSPYFGKYYPDDLLGLESEQLRAYYRGHFRWVLPTILAEQDWRVVTVLRDPVDRILSRFYYLKQYGFIHQSKSFIEWFEHDLTVGDTLTFHFLAEKLNNPEIGPDLVKKFTLRLLGEAQTNLDKCLAVGVMERMEDSVNILAWHLGFLPPKILSKVNPTLVRKSANEISDDLRLRIEQTLSADMTLYHQAKQIFESNKSAMLKSLELDIADGLETITVRNFLREQYVNQLCTLEQGEHKAVDVAWTPDDIFHGENLHARELSGGQCLRWTGPSSVTSFYVYLGKPCNRLVTIMLHAATPRNHVESVLLRVNGFDIPVQISYMKSGEIKLAGNLTEEMCLQSGNNVAEFLITTDTVPGAGEFRILGIALADKKPAYHSQS